MLEPLKNPQQMRPLFVMEQRLLQFHVSFFHQHVQHAFVSDVSVGFEEAADAGAGFGDGKVDVVDGEDAGEFFGDRAVQRGDGVGDGELSSFGG